MCIFGLWEEGGEAGENPHKHGNKNTHLPRSIANRFLTIGVKIFQIRQCDPRQINDQKSCYFHPRVPSAMGPQRSSPGANHSYIAAFTHNLGLIYNRTGGSCNLHWPVIPPLSLSPTHPSPLSSPASIMHTFLARSWILHGFWFLTGTFLSPLTPSHILGR